MKTTACIKQAAILLLLLGTVACDKASQLEYEIPPEGTLRSIQQLKSLCASNGIVVSQEISIRGTVTANDHFGEFMRTLVLEDASGAIRIAIDATELNAVFPVGATVTVLCNGLALGKYGNRVLLGAAPDGRYGVTRIAAADVSRHIRREEDGELFYPATLAFTDVGPEHIDTYVRFDGVRFTSADRWCDLDSQQHPVTTERELIDAAGNTFIVRTAATCIYAREPLPSGTGSICGIINYFGGKYSLCVTARQIFFSTVATLPKACP